MGTCSSTCYSSQTREEVRFDDRSPRARQFRPLSSPKSALAEPQGPFARTALIMIGYQHDYFASEGKLHAVIESSSDKVLKKTLHLIDSLMSTSILIINTPIIFTRDYSELVEPGGILKIIKDVQAFRAGDPGAETIPELTAYGQRILQIAGKRGLNAFTGTCLEKLLQAEGITDVVLCGAVTSVCIDSTGRAAHERGFRVHQLSDVTCGRTDAEQDYYCNEIFPLYADVTTSETLIAKVQEAEAGKSYSAPELTQCLKSNLTTAKVAGKQKFDRTAVIFIGYQHDYFGNDGKLHHVIEPFLRNVLTNTIKLIEVLKDTSALLVQTPIIFTPDYSELVEPSGILKAIKDLQAFRADDPGSESIPEIEAYGDRMLKVLGKRGLNAFTGTCLDGLLRMEQITDVVLCGAVTSICIDSTGRAAHERGYRVHMLSDCTCGRTDAEQEHYCKEIFPLYADVTTTQAIIKEMLNAEPGSPQNRRVNIQEEIDEMNEAAGKSLELAVPGKVDGSYKEFEKTCTPANIVQWMREHPEQAIVVKQLQEEISVQIHHKLIDLAAAKQRQFEDMEQKVAARSKVTRYVEVDEDPDAPLVNFLSHCKDEAGSFSRLLKLMLKRALKMKTSPRAANFTEPYSTPRIFLDSDDIYSQSGLRASVEQCKVFTLILTKTTLFRPWIICEFITAWRLSIPIVVVEVVGSGFSMTTKNAEEMIRQSVDSNTLSLVGQYCPNMTFNVLVECCKSLLSQSRITIDPKGSTSLLWASVHNLSKTLVSRAQMTDGYKLESTTSSPQTFLPQESFKRLTSKSEPDEQHFVYIVYPHSSPDSIVVARILKLMIEAQMQEEGVTSSVFLDADSLFDISSLALHVERSINMIVLLTQEVLSRPWVVFELVHGVRNGLSLLPVPILKDFDFKPFIGNRDNISAIIHNFDAQGKALFKREGIRNPEISRAFMELFNVIAQPFYGHCSETVQRAQVFEIMRRLSEEQGQSPGARLHRGNSMAPTGAMLHMSANM